MSQRRRLRGSERYETDTAVVLDTTIVPVFDPVVLYVLAREYEGKKDTLRSMGEYVEERLIELYPEKAYRGMMSKVAEATMGRMQTIRRMPKYYSTSIDGITLSTPNESYFNSVSDSAEVDLMQMTEAEASAYWDLNALADGETRFDLRDLDSIVVFDTEWGLNARLMSDEIPYIAQEDWALSFVSMGVASSTIYRIFQSKARAEYVARHFYKNNEFIAFKDMLYIKQKHSRSRYHTYEYGHIEITTKDSKFKIGVIDDIDNVAYILRSNVDRVSKEY